MPKKIIGFFIGAGGGIDEPTASIKRLENRLVFKSFDARPDAEGISPACFWSSAGYNPFYINKTRASSGLLPANPGALDYIQQNGLPWRSEAELVRIVEVETETLDGHCQRTDLWPDFLSMDIQGAEYEVLNGAPHALNRLLAILTEVEFRQIYQGQKLFADTDTLLRTASFQFIHLYAPQYWLLHPDDTHRVMTVGEALFLRKPEGLDDGSKEKLAAIAQCFGFHV